ncbi:MAG: hypothetical protein WAV51_02770 [Microgenomates group bacterium]
MKPQDIGFFVLLCILLLLRREKLFVIAGLFCFLLAIPLFAKWIFFTGERLVWYGAAFVTIGILYMLLTKEKKL